MTPAKNQAITFGLLPLFLSILVLLRLNGVNEALTEMKSYHENRASGILDWNLTYRFARVLQITPIKPYGISVDQVHFITRRLIYVSFILLRGIHRFTIYCDYNSSPAVVIHIN